MERARSFPWLLCVCCHFVVVNVSRVVAFAVFLTNLKVLPRMCSTGTCEGRFGTCEVDNEA